jgi:4-amino-4-deoxy-L-arabinose transferase-like glycosyltransferase
MRYDESITYLLFVKLPWTDALTTYTYPNNHVFHTLLAKASVSLLGSAPWAIRLPAFVAGVLIVPATYAVARAMYGARAAILAAAIVASSGILTLYSTNARGYSLVVLAFLLLVLVAIRIQKGGPASHWITFALVAALGLWTIPVMLYPLGTVCLWLALWALVENKSAELRRLAIALAITGGLTLLAYAPVISREGIAALIGNKFVTPQNWLEFFDELPATLRDALWSWDLGVPLVVSIALLACALVALARHARISLLRINLSVAAYAWCAWLLVVNHRAPFARVWLWYLPIAASLAAAGIVLLLERRPSTRRLIERRAPAMAVAFAIAAAISVALSRDVLETRDTGTYADAEQAAVTLQRVLRPNDRVIAALPSNGPIAYYLDRLGVDSSHITLPEQQAGRIFAIIDRGQGQTLASVVASSEARDPRIFSLDSVTARFPSSLIVMYQRRDAAKK